MIRCRVKRETGDVGVMQDRSGKVLAGDSKIRKRGKEYFNQHLNTKKSPKITKFTKPKSRASFQLIKFIQNTVQYRFNIDIELLHLPMMKSKCPN